MDEVRDVAVFGIPDAEYGEKLVAVIMAEQAPGQSAIREFLAPRLATYKIPREVKTVQQIPREDSGKIRKRLLKENWTSL